MKVTPTENYTNYEHPDSDRVGHFVPDKPEEEEGRSFTGAQAVASGLMKYNPVSSATSKIVGMMGSEEAYDPEYSPHDSEELERLAGYPSNLFALSSSEAETNRLMKEYDQARYMDDIIASQPVAGTMGSIAGGALNPLYAIPFLGVAGRGAGAVATGARAAGAAVIGEVITEGITHGAGLDRTRTVDDSMNNVIASAVFSGVLGAAIGSIPRGQAAGLIDEVRTSVTTPIEPSVGSPVPTGQPGLEGIRTLEQVESGAYVPGKLRGRSKAAATLTPVRTLGSENPMVRAVAMELGEQNIIGTQRHAIETAIKSHEKYLVKSMVTSRDEYKKLKKSGVKMDYNEFKEKVSHALRNGDESPIPEVAAAAKSYRKDVIDPITKRAQAAGLLPEELVTKGSKSYLPRIYNKAKINAHRGEFIRHLEMQIRKDPDIAGDVGLARDAAKRVASQIAGDNPTSKVTIKQVLPTGGTRERTINISDNILEPYLVNDIEAVTRQWGRQMTAQSEIAHRYGNIDMKEALDKVASNWDDIILKIESNPKATAKAVRRKTKDIKDLEALRDRLLGRYGMPEDPNSAFVRAGRTARNLNVTRLLGGMTISSMPDLARPIYQHGFKDWSTGIAKLATNPTLRKMAKADQRRMGVAIDTILDSRIRNSSEVDFQPYSATRAEGFIEDLAQGKGYGSNMPGMNKITGQAHWNENVKMMTGMLSQDGLLHKAKYPQKFAKDLRRAGIDDDLARRIREQYDQFGSKEDGMRFGNSDQWTDIDAADAFENTILGQVHNTYIQPGVLDKPLWMSSEMGKTIGQFKSFGFASTNKNLIANMENMNMRVVQGLGAQITLGAMAWTLRQYIYGHSDKVNDVTPEQMLGNAIQYSGVTGMGGSVADMMIKGAQATGLVESDNARFAQDSALNSLLGPSADIGPAAFSFARGVTGESSQADNSAMQRMIPYQNLWYLRAGMGIANEVLE